MVEDQPAWHVSIINFLEDLHQTGVLTGDDQTGKGGHHWSYKPAMDETSFIQYIAEQILNSLIRDFPEETKTALKKITSF